MASLGKPPLAESPPSSPEKARKGTPKRGREESEGPTESGHGGEVQAKRFPPPSTLPAPSKPEDGAIRIAIEGNIAAGKSTFLRILSSVADFVVVPEPVSKWQAVGEESDDEDHFSASQEAGGNLLDMFYSQPTRWGFTFQAYALLSRIRTQMRSFDEFLDARQGTRAVVSDKYRADKKQRVADPPSEGTIPAVDGSSTPSVSGVKTKTGDGAGSAEAAAAAGDGGDGGGGDSVGSGTAAGNGAGSGSSGRSEDAAPSAPSDRTVSKDDVLFFERSVLSDKFCFASNCRASGIFQDVEWRVYCDWHNWLLKAFQGLTLNGIVYLRTKPETCLARLQKRGRSEENEVDLSYLKSLHDRHEEWLTDRVVGREYDYPILVLDCNEEFETSSERQEEMLQKVQQFILNLGRTKP